MLFRSSVPGHCVLLLKLSLHYLLRSFLRDVLGEYSSNVGVLILGDLTHYLAVVERISSTQRIEREDVEKAKHILCFQTQLHFC